MQRHRLNSVWKFLSFYIWIAGISVLVSSAVVLSAESQNPNGSASSGSPGSKDKLGTIVTVTGEVRLQSNQGAARTAKVGEAVFLGETVTTKDGKIKLLMADRTILDLNPKSEFHLNEFKLNNGQDREVDLAINYGTLRTSVTRPIDQKGHFLVRTKSATMGVRGTEFLVRAMGDVNPKASLNNVKTEVTVIQGRVDVGPPVSISQSGRSIASIADKMVSLTAGKQIATGRSGELSKPTQLSSNQLSALSSATKVEDNSFSKAVNVEVKSSGSSSGSSGANSGDRSLASSPISNAASQASASSPGSDMAQAVQGFVTKSVVEQAVASAVAQTLVQQAQAPSKPGVLGNNSGIPGTFTTPSSAAPPVTNLPAGGLRNVKIVIR